MGVGSIIVGVAAFLFMFGGFLTSVVPFLGTMLSFGAPILAIVGIVLGGLGLSRAKRDGEPTGAPTAGLIVNIIALIPALVIALTCGLCNMCITAGAMSPQTQRNDPWWLDGGSNPFAPQPGFPLGADAGSAVPAIPGQPPPMFPPPPMGGAIDAGPPGEAPSGEGAPATGTAVDPAPGTTGRRAPATP